MVSGARGHRFGDCRIFVYFGIFRNYFKFVKENKGERDEGPPCGWAWPPIGKEPETPSAELALRIAPVCKEPPAAREQGPRDQCKNPGR